MDGTPGLWTHQMRTLGGGSSTEKASYQLTILVLPEPACPRISWADRSMVPLEGGRPRFRVVRARSMLMIQLYTLHPDLPCKYNRWCFLSHG
jgi:hypothetical protein